MFFNPSACPTNRRRLLCRRGFTLGEVVVAVLIFGLAATVLVQATSNALNSYILSRRDDRGSILMGHVRRDVLKILSREEVEEGGEVEVPHIVRDPETDEEETELIDVRWEAEIHPTRILDVYILDLTAHFETEGAVASVTDHITTYRPTWGESDQVEQLIEAKEQEFEERLSARGILEEEEEE